MSLRPESEPSIGFVSLGCPKALVDSERILTQLRTEGYRITGSYEDADAVVINTCGFIESAICESLDAIDEALRENGRVIVTGCLGKDADRIRAAFPDVLAISGAHAYEEVLAAVHDKVAPPPHDPRLDLVPPQGIRLTPRHYAYLKVSEGCNHKCSFCIIPQLRGKLVSRGLDDVMSEAQRLVAAGVKELLVISQDTSAYGIDQRYRTAFVDGRPLRGDFAGLCRALGDLPAWVRLHYVYPYPHVDEIVPLMAEGRLLPYLDIPFQHASDRLLRLMKRPAATENLLERIRGWRRICPDLRLRSTFIVGFPGETERDFEELEGFVAAAGIDRLGCFTYSAVAGAAANALPDHVPETVAHERQARLMALQSRLSAARLARRIGSSTTVLIDAVGEDGCLGRTAGDAPEVDGQVHVHCDAALARRLRPGTFATVRITAADDHDLEGVLVGTPTDWPDKSAPSS